MREVALGLIALGCQRGEAVALLSTSRPEWVQSDFEIFTAGCVTVPIYPTYPPELIAYIVNDSQAKTLIVEDPTQLAKALEARSKMEGLEQIIVISGYDAPQLPEMVLTWDTLRRLGRENAEAHKSTLAERGALAARLAPWDEQLATLGMELIDRRRRAAAVLQTELARIYPALSGERHKVEIGYRTQLGVTENRVNSTTALTLGQASQ